MGPWDGAASSGFGCLYGLGAALLVMCLCRPLSPPVPMPVPMPVPHLIPTSPNPKTPLLPLPVTALHLRLSVSGVYCMPGLLRGVGPRVGTSKPTSPLRRRRHCLATPRVSDVEKYADRLLAASGPVCAGLGPFGRVSFKGSRSKDHGRGPPALG